MKEKVEEMVVRMEEQYNRILLSSWKFYGIYLDVKWLINTVLDNIKKIEDLEANHKTSMDNNRRLRVENKRYREALEFYANKKTYKYHKESYIELLKDGGHIARKALRGENHEA